MRIGTHSSSPTRRPGRKTAQGPRRKDVMTPPSSPLTAQDHQGPLATDLGQERQPPTSEGFEQISQFDLGILAICCRLAGPRALQAATKQIGLIVRLLVCPLGESGYGVMSGSVYQDARGPCLVGKAHRFPVRSAAGPRREALRLALSNVRRDAFARGIPGRPQGRSGLRSDPRAGGCGSRS